MNEIKKTESFLFKSILSYGLIGMLRYVIPFLLLPFYTHFLPQNEFASLDLVVSASAIITICLTNFNQGYARFFYKHRENGDHDDFYITMLFSFLAVGVVLLLFFVPSAYMTGDILCPGLSNSGTIFALMVAAVFPQVIMEYNLLNARLIHRKTLFGVLVLADTLSKGVLSIYFIAVLHMGLMGYVLSILLTQTTIGILGTYRLKNIFPGRVRFSLIKKVVSYVMPILPGNIFASLNDYGGRFIMLAYLNLHQIALYALSIRLARVVKLCISSFNQAWQPISMEQISTGDNDEIFPAVLKKYSILAFALLIFGGLLAAPVVTLIAPKTYNDSAQLLPFLVAANLLSGSTFILMAGNYAAMKTYWISVTNLIALIVNISVSFFLIHELGPLAIALGIFCAAIAKVLISYLSAQSSYPFLYGGKSIVILIIGIPSAALILTYWLHIK